jgi:outer membrane receptor protein involved in Fe transport
VATGFSFSAGSASVALKGLPPNDTLTLVDGLRYPQFPFPQVSIQAVISFVDLNSIPLASVDRIEILNDGGSATYGTDAIAGVVNVILKDEYNGADLLNYFGISQRGDAEVYHGSLVGGLTQKLSDTSKVSIIVTIAGGVGQMGFRLTSIGFRSINHVIGTLQPQNIVDLGTGAPAGNFTVRGPSGLITQVVGTYLNLGNERNDGIEFGFTYTTKEFCWGKLDFDFSVTFTCRLRRSSNSDSE